MTVSIVQLCYLWTVISLAVDGKQCVTNGPCSCTFDDGSGTVDITSLGKTDGQPRFKDVPDSGTGFSYSYNPCKPFSEGTCSNVAVCETYNSIPPQQNGIGNQDDATFTYTDADGLKITYTTPGQGAISSTNTILKCDATATGEPTLAALGVQFDLSTKLEMTHACNCPGQCNADGPIPGGGGSTISVGSILLIIFFTSIILYLVVGVLLMVFVKKESGKKVIPNVNFWTALPGYIKDGGIFVVNSARGKRGNYEKV